MVRNLWKILSWPRSTAPPQQTKMDCLFQHIALIADAMPKRNQNKDAIHDRIINRSEYKDLLFELVGDKKKERALKMIYGNAKIMPKIRTTGV